MIKNVLVSSRAISQVYPHWDTTAPALPLRSRLFRLEPIGIGSSSVECLTSYISRLAAEHCVSPRKLFYREILASAGSAIVHYSTTTKISIRLINGMGRLADLTAGTVERLTLCNDLQYMTALSWKDVLSNHLLFRARKAWCPICYEEWRNEGRLIYDPLIWSFTIISLCPLHHGPLCRICPHCKKTSPFLSTFSYPGFCSICRMWLGAPMKGKRQGNKTLVNSSGKVIQISEAQSIGELLSCAVIFDSPPTLRDFTSNLVEYVERRANGSINIFSNLVGIWSGTVRRLLAGKTKLSLKILSQLCSRLNISPHEILSNRGNKEVFRERTLTLKKTLT
ncbi:MAG: hypothetical protein QOE33_2323 [Acidobacteriota bacterium]|nr:hypothetical protein [Acidobacteriota bacterium]